MKFTLWGVRIVISLPFTALLTVFFLIDRTGLATLSALTVLLHETAHLFAMAACGVRPQAIRLVVGAVEIVAPSRPKPRWQEICIWAAGPGVNLLAGTALCLLWRRFGGTALVNAAVLQFSFGLFNLLPAAGLDGGSILTVWCGERFARMPGIVSFVTLLLLTVAGAVLFFLYGGAGLLFAAVYLLTTGLLCAQHSVRDQRTRQGRTAAGSG